MANRPCGGGSSGRPSGFPPEPPPPFPRPELLTTPSWSVTYVSGLKCYPCLRPSSEGLGRGAAARYAAAPSARFFARFATIPTMLMSPMDLPMESSRPKTS
jgi:hypothetical protein